MIVAVSAIESSINRALLGVNPSVRVIRKRCPHDSRNAEAAHLKPGVITRRHVHAVAVSNLFWRAPRAILNLTYKWERCQGPTRLPMLAGPLDHTSR